jgi:SRSO17 transposase
VSVELVVSDGFVAAPVGGRLYLPQSWIDDPQRRAKAGVPPDVGFATKNEIALTLIEQALADQVVPAPVLGDAAYGNSFAFREHLRELNLEFFLQVTPEEHKGWIQEVPTTLKGKYRIGRRLRAPPLVHWHGDAYCVPSQRPFCSPQTRLGPISCHGALSTN